MKVQYNPYVMNTSLNFKAKHPAFEFTSDLQFRRKTYYGVEPVTARNWNFNEACKRLKGLITEEEFNDILYRKKTVPSPNSKEKDGYWLHQSKIIGINPRAIGTYFDIVKYAMTFPENSIHILPLFEQGCNKSLYAPINFKLSEEFMDKDLTRLGFDTPEKQLKLTVNLLHALGKNVGMDFLQHTDRYSEEVFVNPDNFIWIKLNTENTRQLEYPEINPDRVSDEVKDTIVDFLVKNGNSEGERISKTILNNFYSLSEDRRRTILFGEGTEKQRSKRKDALMDYVRTAHFETLPASYDNPRKKISFKEIKYGNGVSWAEFTDNDNNHFFGNLTPYKLYHLNNYGTPDISRPNESAWNFIQNKTLEFQKMYGFDFLRSDMGSLNYGDSQRDIHANVKEYIQNKSSKHFGTFGECIFRDRTPAESLKRKNYDIVLGNLQYKSPYECDFVDYVKEYNCNPNLKITNAIMTIDSDSELHNNIYDNSKNTIKLFFGLFLNQPSYTSMGFETRNEKSLGSEYYTNNFINNNGKKYLYGNNKEFFNTVSSMRKMYSKIKDTIQNQYHYWLNTSDRKVASWFYYSKKDKIPSYFFVSNTSGEPKKEIIIQNIFDTNMADKINKKTNKIALNEIYSTDYSRKVKKMQADIILKGQEFKVTNLAPNESRIYKATCLSKD